MQKHFVEGSWEDVLTHAEEFKGHRVRVIVLDDGGAPRQDLSQLSSDEIEERLSAWKSFSSEPLSDAPLLSDFAVSRESFYDNERL